MRTALLVTLALLAACGNTAAPADPESPDSGLGGGNNPGTTPNAAVVTVGGCQVFPGDNAWNRDVSGDPLDPASDVLLAHMSPRQLAAPRPGDDRGVLRHSLYRGASEPTPGPISYGTDGADYSDESDPGPMPIPLDVAIEGGSTADPNPASGD